MRRHLIWALALVLATVGIASAQGTTGTLAGIVNDAQGAAIPGATVTLTSDQGTKTFVTDSSGRFNAPFLTVGRYNVKVELAGFSPVERKNVDVRLGTTYDLSFTLSVGQLQEVIEVVGGRPVIDTSSTTTGGSLDSETMKRLPVGRNFTDTLYLVPGVSNSNGAGNSNPSIGGASGLENNYVVDGVNITDTGFGGAGSYNSVYGSLGNAVSTDFIKETQVKTAGFEAEYGQATGGVVNVVTKSGSNDFHGSVFGYFRPDSLEGSWNQLQTAQGTVNTTGRNDYDFGVSLGAPIIKDKLFFFGTFNPQYQKRAFIAPEPSNVAGAAGPVTFPYRALGDVERKRKSMSYAGKLTYQAGPNHRFDASVFGDPSKGDLGLQRFTTLRRVSYPGAPGTTAIDGGFSEIEYGGNSQTLRYDGIISPNWLVEASVAHATSKFEETSPINEPIFTDVRPGNVPTGTTGGLGTVDQNQGKNTQFSLKSTNLFSLGGQHQVRYGASFEDIKFTRDTNWTGPTIPLADGNRTLEGAPIQIRTAAGVTFYRATRGRLVPAGETTQKYYSLFLQDTWQIGGRLTIRPGVRYERQKLTGQTPGDQGAPTLCHSDDSRPGAGDGSGSAIPCTFTWDNNWAPRIGVTYDIRGNGRSKLYASYGRFYAKIPNDLAARAMSSDSGITRQNFRDPGLTQPVPNGEVFAGSATNLLRTSDAAAIIDPNAGSTYSDEFVGGAEFEVGHSVNLGVRYIHRNLGQILEDIGQLPVAGYFLAECGDTTVDYFITNPGTSTAAINCPSSANAAFEDPVHKYDAFEVTATKTFSDNWSLMASYRYAKLKGSFEGFFRSDNGQSDPSISSLYDFPTNDLSYSQYASQLGFRGDIRYQGTTLGQGVLPNERPHQFKLYGNYVWNNLNVGLGFNYGSGQSLTALAGNAAYVNAGEIPETLRGAGIQTTTDGFLERAQSEVQVDLHLDYGFKINDKQRVTLLADVFNLINNQDPLNYDNYTELVAGTLNPNFGVAANGGNSSAASFAPPRSVRVGARFEW